MKAGCPVAGLMMIVAVVAMVLPVRAGGESVDVRQYMGWDSSNISERNQSHCGDCFVWTGTALMEIDLNRKLSLKERLSVEFYNSCFGDTDCYPEGAGECVCTSGAREKDVVDFAKFYSYKGFAIPWSNTNAAFADGSGTCSTPVSSIGMTPRYTFSGPVTGTVIATTGVSTSEAIENIKAILKQGKGVYFGKHTPYSGADDFSAFWHEKGESVLWNASDGTSGSEPKGVDAACGAHSDDASGHAMTIVGFEDSDADPAKHYWMVMNSWGTRDNRPNALFRMPMQMNYECRDDKNKQLRLFQYVDVPVAACTIALSSSALTMESDGGAASLSVTAGCAWAAASDASWLTITGGGSGTENGTMTLSVAENTTLKARTGSVSVGTEIFTVTQKPLILSVDGSSSGDCFIATAAFGSYVHPCVRLLRKFRDTILLASSPGRSVVQWYYRVSPPIADVIARHAPLRMGVRILLLPAIGIAWVWLNVGMIPLMLILCVFGAAVVAGTRKAGRRL